MQDLLDLSIRKQLNSADNSCSFNTPKKFKFGERIEIENEYYIINSIYHNITNDTYYYTAISEVIEILQRQIFSDNYNLITDNFINFFKKFVDIEVKSFDNLQLDYNIALNNQNYFNALLQICEINNLYCYPSQNKLIIGKNFDFINYKNFNHAFEVIDYREEDSDYNKLYFTNEFAYKDVPDYLKNKYRNILFEDEKGLYVTIKKDTIKESQNIVNDININNLTNEKVVENIEITLLYAYNRLLSSVETKKSITIAPIYAQRNDQNSIELIQKINYQNELYYLDNYEIAYIDNSLVYNCVFSNFITESIAIRTILRNIERKNNKNNKNIRVQVFNFDVNVNEEYNEEIKLEKQQNELIKNVEMNITVSSNTPVNINDVMIYFESVNINEIVEIDYQNAEKVRIPFTGNIALKNTFIYDNLFLNKKYNYSKNSTCVINYFFKLCNPCTVTFNIVKMGTAKFRSTRQSTAFNFRQNFLYLHSYFIVAINHFIHLFIKLCYLFFVIVLANQQTRLFPGKH